jgi:hypothetical protein
MSKIMSRKDILLKKYPDYANEALAIEDPSNGKNKYLIWIANQLKAGHNPADISATLSFFHSNPDRFDEKDIHKYKDLKTLEGIIKEMGLSKRKEKEKNKEGGVKILENEEFLVVRADDKSSMILYGSETEWCTTMKDQVYYEEYVNNGNDFYILISKKKGVFTSSKYAIVRKSFLEFQVYDANDSYAREFTEVEQDKLRIVLQAIIMDKPPKNYLREVCAGNVSAQETLEWLNTQSDVTRGFVEERRSDIKFINMNITQLIKFLSKSTFNLKSIDLIEYSKIVEMAKEISLSKGSRTPTAHLALKKNILIKLKDDDKLIMAKDKDTCIREMVITKISPEMATQFLNDRSISVLKCAARRVDIAHLLEFANKTKSIRKQKAINEVITERLSKEKVMEFILTQPKNVLMSLII